MATNKINWKYSMVSKPFFVFIAFNHMRSKAKDAELNSKELLKQTLGLFAHEERRNGGRVMFHSIV